MAFEVSDDTTHAGLMHRVRRYLYNDLVSSFREELDELTSNNHEQAKEQIKRVLELAVAHSEERVRLTIDEIARPFREKEQQALEQFSDQMVKQRSQQLEAQVEAILQGAEQQLEKVHGQAGHNVSGALDQVRLACDTEVDKASNAIAKTAGIVNITVESGAARLKELSQQMEGDFERTIEQHRSRLQDWAAPALEGFRHEADNLLRDIREHAGASLRSSLDQVTEEFATRAGSRAQDLLASWSEQLQRETQYASLRLREQIEASANVVAEQNERKREAMAAALKQHADDAVESFRHGLQNTLHDYAETGARELEARLEEVEHRHFAAIRDQLSMEIAEVGERSIAEARARLDRATTEVCDNIYKQIGMATVALQDLANQARQRLEGSLDRSLETLSVKIETATEANLGELKKEVGSVVDGIRERLRQAAQALQVEPNGAGGTTTAGSSESPAKESPAEASPKDALQT
ncbi:MAG TPA: hypothetical protein VG204_07140 [Terriglobia bacterium]|nr:hypothetical protein [Terriglobia bacterium]